MTIRQRMSTRFTLYSRVTSIGEVVRDIEAGKTLFYIAVQDRGQFAVTTLPLMKGKLAAIADDYGSAALGMCLGDVDGLWAPRAGIAPDADDEAEMRKLSPGESAPVVENGVLLGILARPNRGVGSSGLGSMYGPRFALFGSEKLRADNPPPARSCPHCGKSIEFYAPRRVGNVVERHCPQCDLLVAENQP